ncbi:hypothetical protein [Nocardia sp. NRRL S-836]|uniref:hypothetical protein n=1 Tax=Nocardia sp. NRRL S-836 TaxID=1519492 RepID=UPI0012F7FEDE|nr:hypothetical protein [Nocardia sp. NRRL S-836]
MKRGIIAVAMVLLGFVFPGVANAEAPPGCAGAGQIGATGYIKFQGNTIASVKQFAGCGSNYSYVYVWESFRNSGKNWNIQTAIATYSSSGDTTPNDYKGGNSTPNGLKELWGKPANTLNTCTAAYGMIYVYQYDTYTGYSSKRC